MAAPKVKPLTIDLDGLSQRLYEVPVPGGDDSALAAGAKLLFWLEREAGSGGQAAPDGARDRHQGPETGEAGRGRDLVRAVARRQETARAQEGRPLRARGRRQGPGRAGQEQAGPLRLELPARRARGLAPDLRRRLAPGARLLLRPRACTASTGRRCSTTPPAARRPRHDARRAVGPDRLDGGRAVGAAHERPRRRPAPGARRREGPDARRAARARRGEGRLPHRARLPPRPRLPAGAFAAGGPRARHRRGRRDHDGQRRAGRSRPRTRTRCCATRRSARCCCACSRPRAGPPATWW